MILFFIWPFIFFSLGQLQMIHILKHLHKNRIFLFMWNQCQEFIVILQKPAFIERDYPWTSILVKKWHDWPKLSQFVFVKAILPNRNNSHKRHEQVLWNITLTVSCVKLRFKYRSLCGSFASNFILHLFLI